MSCCKLGVACGGWVGEQSKGGWVGGWVGRWVGGRTYVVVVRVS